jgi:hypothetical protein
MSNLNMKITVSWDVTVCSLGESYQHFRGCLYLHDTLVEKAAGSSKHW